MAHTRTAELATFLSQLDIAQVPSDVLQETKNLILDSLACMIAGSYTEVGPIVLDLCGLFGNSDEASVAGSATRTSALSAAYGNGRLGDCLDLDETYPGGLTGGVHFGSSAVAAALAFCEREAASGADLLMAALCGYELGGRVSSIGTQLVIKDGELVGRPRVWGMSLSAVYAAMGATSKALSLDEKFTEEAFGLAASNIPPLIGPIWSAMTTLPNTKYADFGWCTLAGAFAAASAKAKSTGPAPVFEGDRNIFEIMGLTRFEPDGLFGELGERWCIRDITYKPWPSCRWHHQALTALQKIQDEEELAPDEIDSITVQTGLGLLSHRFINQDPPNFASRQFSFPHAVAMLLCKIAPGADWVSDEAARRDAVVKLRRKVKIEAHPRASAFVQDMVRDQVRAMPSAIRIHARGRVYFAESEHAVGDSWDPELRWGFEDIAKKFRTVTGLPDQVCNAIIASVAQLEKEDSIDVLAKTLRVRPLL